MQNSDETRDSPTVGIIGCVAIIDIDRKSVEVPPGTYASRSFPPPPFILGSPAQLGSPRAFTLIELLIVMSVIAILAVLTSVVAHSSFDRMAAARTVSDLRQIGVGMLAFASENDGLFPISGGTIPYGAVDPLTLRPSWQEQIEDYTGGDRTFFEGDNRANRRSAYFNGSSAAYEEANAIGAEKVFGAVRLSRIMHPSKYALAGEIRYFILVRKNDSLLIRAELDDAHPMKDVFPFNFPAFQQCDAFEIFIGPADERAYYEFHVTPSNSVLQLFFEGTEDRKSLDERMVAEPLFSSGTSVTPTGWHVDVRLPLEGLFPGYHPEWLLSFGRYDYSPGHPGPVISSTSPHTICNFHRKDEWRRVRMTELAPI